jgi:hypothetical protein
VYKPPAPRTLLYAFLNKPAIFFILISVIVGTLVVDTSVIKVYSVNFNQLPMEFRVIIFIVIVCTSVFGLYIIHYYAKEKIGGLGTRGMRLQSLARIVQVSIYLLTLVILILIADIIFQSSYSIVLLTLTIWISYLTAITIMGFLAYSFFSWFKSNRNPVVLLYGLASSAFAVTGAFTIVISTLILENQPLVVIPHGGAGYPFFSMGWSTLLLENGENLFSTLTYLLWWFATILVLRHYSERSRTKRHWFILCIPSVYFLLQFQPLFLSIASLSFISDPVLFTVIYTIMLTLSKPIGGIIFSLAFWSIARKLGQDSSARRYLILSAYGILLMFVAEEAIYLATAAYPPFGLATTSFMGLSAFLVFVGIYATAISVAVDTNLRKLIHRLALKQTKWLDSIGAAQMQQDYVTRVVKVVKKNKDVLKDETRIESSLTDDDVKDYLKEVIKEIELNKKTSK